MHKRTRACQIPKRVKEAVYERDGHKCVGCGRWARPEWSCAHYIARSHGGLGVEKNILTLCPDCHGRYDNSPDRQMLKQKYGEYLMNIYGDLEGIVYRKWS